MTPSLSSGPISSGPIFIGIDVAKAKLDLGRSDVRRFSPLPMIWTASPRSLRCSDLKPAIIVIEATGGLSDRCWMRCSTPICPRLW